MTNAEIVESLQIIQERARRAEAECISLRELAGRIAKSLGDAPARAEFEAERLGSHREADERERQPVNGVRCNCGLPATLLRGTARNGKPWAGYFCNRAKNDPKNCGFRQWVD